MEKEKLKSQDYFHGEESTFMVISSVINNLMNFSSVISVFSRPNLSQVEPYVKQTKPVPTERWQYGTLLIKDVISIQYLGGLIWNWRFGVLSQKF